MRKVEMSPTCAGCRAHHGVLWRNPDWNREETILALALYNELQGKIPSGSDRRVQELSNLLRTMPYHANASRKPTFRNPDGVAFKLQNLRQIGTGKDYQM